jgi:hypothetical protein
MLMLNECEPTQGLIFRRGTQGSFTGVFACGGLIVSSQSDVFAWFSSNYYRADRLLCK